MFLRRSLTRFHSNTPPVLITRIWANDGWCYIPELKKREKFFTVKSDTLRYVSEDWNGIIPLGEHTEQLTYYPCSQKPLVWTETGPLGWFETYEEINATPHNHIQLSQH